MEGENSKSLVAGTLAVIGANVIWGFGYIPTKLALLEVNPFALLLLRLIFAAPLFLLLLICSRIPLRSLLKNWPQGLVLAVLAVLGSQLFFQIGLTHTTPAHSAFIYALLPIFTAIIAFFLLKERLYPVQVIGVGLAFIGVLILTTEDGLTFESKYLLGDLLTLVGALAWAAYTVVSKPVVSRIGSIQTLALVFLLGLPLALPFTLMPSLEQSWQDVGAVSWLSVAFLVLFATFTAYLFYQFSIKRLQATIVAVFSYSQPILAAIFAVLLMGETLSQLFLTAAAFILVGLILAQRWNHGKYFGKKNHRMLDSTAVDEVAELESR